MVKVITLMLSFVQIFPHTRGKYMPIFIDPTGLSTYGIGVCARCWRKFPLEELHSDPNTPGLKVCEDDIDQYDPYRLPARRTEDIHLRFNRPDEQLTDGGSNPNPDSLFAVRSAQTVIRTTTSGVRRTILPPLPSDVTDNT